MSFLDKIQRCNQRDLRRLVPFVADGVPLGWLAPERAEFVLGMPAVFAACQPPSPKAGVTLAPGLSRPGLTTPDDRTAAIADIAAALTHSGLFPPPRGELYGVKNRWADAAAFRLDRAFVPGFGVRAYGVHLNGFVRKAGGLHLWIGTRARDRQVEPGKLDNMVAGGQPAGLGLAENLVKECAEEADLAADIARRAVPVGVIAYAFEAREGLKADTLFCYDLEVPDHITPQPSEEITRFELMPLHEVLALVRDTDAFKFNVNLVILDFAIRHGVLNPERERDFEAIAAGLREWPQQMV